MGGDQDAVQADLLRAIVSGAPDPMFVKDLEGRYVFCNESTAIKLGRTVAEVIGATDLDLFSPEHAEALRVMDAQVIATGLPMTFEEQVPFSGKLTFLLTKKFPYVGADGKVLGVVGIVRDITDRADAVAALAERERLLRSVLDALPVSVFVLAGNGDMIIHNAKTETIWGRVIESGAERWRSSRGCWHDTGRPLEPGEWASVRALAEGIAILDQIVDIEGFDGKRRTVRNSAVPIIAPSGVVGAVVLNEDITESLALQASLAHAQKMEAIGRLASGIAHDFNNMLTVIYAYALLVRDSLAPTDRRRTDLDQLLKASESASSLTHQLLAFGRREINKPQPVTLEAVVRDTEKLLVRTLEERIRIVTELAQPENRIWIDPRHLEQVLVNLAINARDAMLDGGELRITSRTDAARRVAMLSVQDTGHGMDAQTLEKIFEPFFTTKERGRGSGLGLAIVHGIVEQAHGSIRTTSTVGHGTMFEIELPLCRDEQALEAATTPVVSTARGSESILLVEDSIAVRLAVRAMLLKLGYTVHDVDNGAAAHAHVDSGARVDLLITDVVLAADNGREVADQIVAKRPDLRVLFISGWAADESVRTEAIRAVLPKPFTIEQLSVAVRHALEDR